MRGLRLLCFLLLALGLASPPVHADSEKIQTSLRGAEQTFYYFAPRETARAATVAVVISGDGGWRGLIIDLAQHLADCGYPALGVDARDYLSTMSKPKALEPAQVTSDVAAIARLARERSGAKSVVLAGWSEGAGLAVLGGLDPSLRPSLRGVMTIGLPELNELAWRFSDSIIYLTHKVPNEPAFNSKDYIGRLAPAPLMMIQSLHDDFSPETAGREIFARAQEPKQIVFLDARNHHFSGQRPAFFEAVDRALDWFERLAPESPR